MRDYKKDVTYYENYISSHKILLEKIQEGIQTSGDDEERRMRYVLAKGNTLYNLIKANYSMGNSIDVVKSYFDELLDEMEEFFCEYSSILYMYDMMALAILFEVSRDRFSVLCDITHKLKKEDAITHLYENYFYNKTISVNGKTLYGNPYDKLLEIIGKEDVQKNLANYLKKDWYKENRQAFWHDSHKAKQDVYVGYWSFEAGAIAKILNLDDDILKDVPYYPYDLVHYKE